MGRCTWWRGGWKWQAAGSPAARRRKEAAAQSYSPTVVAVVVGVVKLEGEGGLESNGMVVEMVVVKAVKRGMEARVGEESDQA